MFVPPIYKGPVEDEHSWVRLIIDENPLATLVTNGDSVPHASRIPAILPGTSAEPLEGREVSCHLNRSNPHWQSLEDGAHALLIFDGPTHYVCPSVYEPDPAAPTWDFVSVHVIGVITRVPSGDETFNIVRRTAELLEARFGDGCDYRNSWKYFHEILPGVGAFRIRILSVDAMFKLSQEKSPVVQQRIIDRFRAAEESDGSKMASLMKAFGLGELQ